MGKKLNTLTQEQAEKIWDGRPKLPVKKILTFAHKQVFVNEQYFFKYKECDHRYGYCTACGKDVQIDIENMRLWTDKHAACRSARHNDTVCCPACGHKVQIKDAGRGHNGLCNTAVIAVAQRTRNGGILLSFVRVYEDYTHDFKAVPEMGRLLYAAYFNIGQHFVAKYSYYGDEMSVSIKQKPTHQLPCTVEPVKMDHNRWNCTGAEGAKLLGFEEALEKSNLRYLPWEAYHECAQQLYRSAIANYPVNLLGLLYQYSRHPVLTERLIKEGNGDLVAEQVEWNCTTGMDYKQVVPYKAMRLTKQEYRMLKTQDNICCSTLKATKALKKYGCKMTDENFRFFLVFQHSWSQQKCYKALDVLRQNLSPQKAINWVNRQAAGYGTPTNVLSDYSDYLDQCRRLGLDVNRKEVAVPQNLRDLHRQYSEELTRRANEKKAKEQAERSKKLAKDLPKLKRKYAYASSGLFIRPAEGPEDLLKEGCAQHNCVYSCYTEQYLDRKTDILFVRKQSDPDQSYVTVEFKNGAVIQCRADHNRPAPPDVQEFMQAWLAYLKSNRKTKAVS